MNNTGDLELRAVAQISLTTHITPRIRSISLDINRDRKEFLFRAYTDGQLPESAHEALMCALTEISAAYPAEWKLQEEIIALPEPGQMDYLRLVVYVRCEDDWVDRSI